MVELETGTSCRHCSTTPTAYTDVNTNPATLTGPSQLNACRKGAVKTARGDHSAELEISQVAVDVVEIPGSTGERNGASCCS